MSLYQFLKEQNFEKEEGETLHSEESTQGFSKEDSTIFGFPVFILCFLLFFLILWCCRNKTIKKESTSIRLNIYFQNIFQNPVIRDVSFHQGDHVVPSDFE